MQKFIRTFLVGLVAVTAVMAADTPMKEPALPAGVTPKVLDNFKQIRKVLASATDAAVTKGGFDNLIDRLTSPDRKRIGDFSEHEFAELDGRIDQIRKNWKLKYGDDLNMTDAFLDGFVVITEGEIANPDVAQKNWPVPADSNAKPNSVAPNNADTIKYLDKGRDVALVYYPTSHDLASVTVSMIREPGLYDWRIDVPDNLTGQVIHDRLKDTLTAFGDNVAGWPSEARDAYRMLSHRVLLAVYGLPFGSMDQARPAADRAAMQPSNRPVAAPLP